MIALIIRNDHKPPCPFLGGTVDVRRLDGVLGGGGGVTRDCGGGVEARYCLIVNVYVAICRSFSKNSIIHWPAENTFPDILPKPFKGYADREPVRGTLPYHV